MLDIGIDCHEPALTQKAALPTDQADTNDQESTAIFERLTPKERVALHYLSTGVRNKEIAGRLNTTERVVKNCLRHIYRKLGVSDRLQAALFVLNRPMLQARLKGLATQDQVQ
jgi:DNA-binding NarL/FixJ family response regulator